MLVDGVRCWDQVQGLTTFCHSANKVFVFSLSNWEKGGRELRMLFQKWEGNVYAERRQKLGLNYIYKHSHIHTHTYTRARKICNSRGGGGRDIGRE